MVMITRSAYKKACESSSSSDASQNNKVPPWCSSGKVFARKQGKVPPSTWEIRSSYPLRENIWEYLSEGREGKVEQSDISGKRRQCNCKQKAKRKTKEKNATILCALVIIAAGLMASVWITNTPNINLLTKVAHRDKLVSQGGEQRDIADECCSKMRYLALQLSKVHQTLRHAQRVRRTMMISTQIARTVDRRYIKGATVTKGTDTEEYGGQVALWGVIPLWRATPFPDIVLAQRKPTPSDCWPFRVWYFPGRANPFLMHTKAAFIVAVPRNNVYHNCGSQGEIVIDLSEALLVRYLSIEHIRPDTARSAPKKFNLYGILGNGTWINVVAGEYQSKGPAKQYYTSSFNASLTKLVFRVLSNHGNPKYSCIYRVHLYKD